MATTGTLAAYRNAVRVALRNLPILLFWALVVGAVGSALSSLAADFGASLANDGRGPSGPADRSVLVASELSRMVAWTFWQGIVGALGASAAVYLWVRDAKGESTSLRESINFALNRAGRVIPAHLKAFAMVFWGAQVFIPGLLFGLQLAFVDAVATLDDKEASPLDRSRRLTRGRRGMLARALVPAALWWLVYSLLGLFVLKDQGMVSFAVGGALDHVVNALMDMVLVQLYVEEVRRRVALADAKRNAESSPASETAPES